MRLKRRQANKSMSKTKFWSVWHIREEKTIIVKVAPYQDGKGMKFRTITPNAAARQYIRYNLWGDIAKDDECWQRTAKTKNIVRIQVYK